MLEALGLSEWRGWKWRRLYWVLAGAFLVGLLIGQITGEPDASVPPGAPAEAHLTDR